MTQVHLKYGIVSQTEPGFAKVYFEEDDIVSPWWPVLQRTSLRDKESWPLNIQEHVVCVCDHRLREGVILGAIYSDVDKPEDGAGDGKFRKVFEDGTFIEYDKSTHKLTADVKGDVFINAENKMTATAGIKASIAAPEVEVTGNLTVIGNLSFSGTLAGGPGGGLSFDSDTLTLPKLHATAEVKSGTVDLHNHAHSGVTTGGGTSGPPVP